MKFFEICADVLVPKFTRGEVRLPGYMPVPARSSALESVCSLWKDLLVTFELQHGAACPCFVFRFGQILLLGWKDRMIQ